MAMNPGFQQQQPLGWSAAVRSAPSPRQAQRLKLDGEAAPTREEKSFTAPLKR